MFVTLYISFLLESINSILTQLFTPSSENIQNVLKGTWLYKEILPGTVILGSREGILYQHS